MLAEGAVGVNRVSDYQRGRSNTMPTLHPGAKKTACDYCGGGVHKDKKDCPAWGANCDRCGKENHLAKVCRSRAAAGTNLIQLQDNEEAAELFTVSAGATAFQLMPITGRPLRGQRGRTQYVRKTHYGFKELLSEEDLGQADHDLGQHGALGGPHGGEGGDIQYTGTDMCGKLPLGTDAAHVELTRQPITPQSTD